MRSLLSIVFVFVHLYLFFVLPSLKELSLFDKNENKDAYKNLKQIAAASWTSNYRYFVELKTARPAQH